MNNQLDFRAGTSGLLFCKSIGRQKDAKPIIQIENTVKIGAIKLSKNLSLEYKALEFWL